MPDSPISMKNHLPEERCPLCEGSGFLRTIALDPSDPGPPGLREVEPGVWEGPCPDCGGSGKSSECGER